MEQVMNYFGKVSRRYVSLVCVVALMATSIVHAFAQQTPQKRALTHKDYDSWRSIQSPQISRDGKFVAYAYMAQDGDSEIVARNIATGAEWRAPRGYRPPAPPPDDSLPNFGELIAAQARLSRPVFTADSRFVVFSIEPTKAELNQAKKEKKKPEDMPKNGLGIMELSNGQVAKIDRVKNFQVPEDGSGLIAYLLEAKPAAPPNKESGSEPPAVAGGPARSSQAGAPRGAKKKEYGTDLFLRNTATGADRTFNDVIDYTLSKDAKTLAYTVASKNEETNGVYVVSTQTEAPAIPLLVGKGKYQKLTWDEDQTELAFISDRDDQESKPPKSKVYMWERGSSAPVADRGSSPIPGSPAGQPSWGGAVREGANLRENHATALPAPIATEIV